MLDVSIRADILKLMAILQDEKGISYLFITHDLSLAWLISDRVAIMYLGEIVEIGGSDICDYLQSKGFAIRKGIGEFDTAFVATYGQGSGGYHVAYCAEYDALPEVGHACGHNLIGIASVAAGVALAGCKSDVPFQVSVIGTPDEEGRGGKIDLIKAGVFDNVDIAMMFHPGYTTTIHANSLALQTYEFIFHGQNAHVASEPGRAQLTGCREPDVQRRECPSAACEG